MGKNINEEIERIKSLFTEERLYGNLITEQNDDDDMFSMKKARELKKNAKINNNVDADDENINTKDRLKGCNKSLNYYHKAFFADNPKSRQDIDTVVDDSGKGIKLHKEKLEYCVNNYKDKLNVPNFADMSKNDILDMLLIMLDTNKGDEERNKYKTVTKGGIFKRKDNVTTSDAIDIIDESDGNWGTVEIVKNRQKVFLIRVVKGESVVTNNEWSQVNKVLDNFIPALIKAILSINPELKTEIKDSNELKVLKTEGTSYSGEQIKIKVI